MKTKSLIILALFFVFPTHVYSTLTNNQKNDGIVFLADSLHTQPGIALYGELIGKGFCSVNVDFPINPYHHFSFGFTLLDYSIEPYEEYHVGGEGAFTPGLMYYFIQGKGNSYFEMGAGFSLFYRLDVDYVSEDSPLSLHGVLGYRYQKPNGLIFRAGFTPFKRINGWFLPLVGVSLGYSW